MLKFFGRCMVFLLISCLIAAGLYVVIQYNPAVAGGLIPQRGLAGRGFGHEELGGGRNRVGNANHESRLSLAARGPGRHERLEGGIALGTGLVGILRNLGFIALMTAGVVGVSKIFSLVFRRQASLPAG